MCAEFGIVYPLWTDPRGPADLLERAAGEIGLDHVTIPVVTGRVEQFRLEPADPPHYFVSEGGWHYPPDLSCYDAGPVKPRTARWSGRRDVLRPICEFAQKRNIRVIFRIELRSVPSLLEHESHLRTRNAWGDDVPGAGACTMNPSARELLRGTLEDLRRYAPSGFQIAEWSPDCPIHELAPWPIGREPTVRRLMGTCFCPACQEIGTDPESARRIIHTCIRGAMADGDLAPIKPQDELHLDAYTESKFSDAARWLQRLAHTHSDSRGYLLSKEDRPLIQYAKQLAENAFVPILHCASGGRAGSGETAEFAPLRLVRPSGLTVPASRAFFGEAQRLVRLVNGSVEAGCAFFDFESLEEAGSEMLEWVRQAVRYARRG